MLHSLELWAGASSAVHPHVPRLTQGTRRWQSGVSLLSFGGVSKPNAEHVFPVLLCRFLIFFFFFYASYVKEWELYPVCRPRE